MVRFIGWRKAKYHEKSNDLPQVTDNFFLYFISHNVVSSSPLLSEVQLTTQVAITTMTAPQIIKEMSKY